MLEYCLNCDYENDLKPLIEAVTVTVRGEDFKVSEEFYKCLWRKIYQQFGA